MRFSVICYAWYSVIADTTFAHAMQLIVDILLQTVRDHFGLSDDHLNAFVRQFYDRLPASLRYSDVSILLTKPCEVVRDGVPCFSDLSSNDFTNYDNTDKNCVLDQEKKIINYKLIKPELIRIRKKGRIYYDEMRQLQIKLLNKKYN